MWPACTANSFAWSLLPLLIGLLTGWWAWARYGSPRVAADGNAGFTMPGVGIGAVTGAVGGLAGAAATAARSAVDGAGDAASAAAGAAKAGVGTVTGTVSGVIDKAGDVVGGATGVASDMLGAVGGAAGAVAAKAGDIAGGAVNVAKGAVETGVDVAGTVVGKVGDVAGSVAGAVGSAGQSALDLAGGAVAVGGATLTAIGIPGAVGDPDDLTLLKGVGEKLNAVLHGLGIYRFDQIAGWSADDIAKVNPHLGAFSGRIERENWVDQAALLARGATAEFEAKYGILGSENK